MILWNPEWVEDPFKVQDRSMDLNVTKYGKLIPIGSDCTLHLTFKEPPLKKKQTTTCWVLV